MKYLPRVIDGKSQTIFYRIMQKIHSLNLKKLNNYQSQTNVNIIVCSSVDECS